MKKLRQKALEKWFVLRLLWVSYLLSRALMAQTKLALALSKAGFGISAIEFDLRFWAHLQKLVEDRLDVHRESFRAAFEAVEERDRAAARASRSPMDDPQFREEAAQEAVKAGREAVDTLRALSLRKES